MNSFHPYTIEVLYCTTLGVLLDALGLLTLNHKSYVSFVRSNYESRRKCFHDLIHRGVSCICHLNLTVPFQYDSLRDILDSYCEQFYVAKYIDCQIFNLTRNNRLLTTITWIKCFWQLLNFMDYRVR